MARIRWFYFLFSLAIGGLLLTLWIRGEARTAQSYLNSAVERLAAADARTQEGFESYQERVEFLIPIHDAALREFDAAIMRGRLEGAQVVIREALDHRSQFFLERNMAELALEDALTLLEEFGESHTVLSRVAEAALRLDRPDRALDAAVRLGRLEPGDADSSLLLGRAHLALAEQSLAQCRAMIAAVLAPVDVEDVMTWARRATALPPSVRGHGTSREQVRAVFDDPHEADEAIAFIDLAGEHTSAGLSGLVHALEQEPDGAAIAGIQDILMYAGAFEAAAELGIAAMKLSKLPRRSHALVRTGLALAELERFELAKKLIELQVKKHHNLSLYALEKSPLLPAWCALLDKLELWQLLRTAATHVLNGDRDNILAAFYHSIAAFHVSGPSDREAGFLGSIAPNLPDIPELQLRGWVTYAEIAKASRDTRLERHTLTKATRVLPENLGDNSALRQMLGQAWLRRSQIEDELGETIQAEASATHALTLLPEERKQTWIWLNKIGRQALVKRGTSLDTIKSDLQKGVLPPANRVGPFADAVVLRHLVQKKRFHLIRNYADLLLLEYPDHPDALEAMLELHKSTNTYAGVVEVSLRLLENGFNVKRARGALAEVPPRHLKGRDLKRWMRADPASAAGAVLSSMLANERIEEALSLTSRPQLREIDGRVLVQLGLQAGASGHWSEAFKSFQHIAADDPVLERFTGSMLRAGMYAAMQAGDADLLTQAFRRFDALALAEATEVPEGSGILDPAQGGLPDLLRAFDSLYAADRQKLALRILGRLEENPGTETGEVLLRRAVFAVIQRQEEAYRRASERADPFFDDARVSLGELLVAADTGDWTEVSRFAFGLLRGEFGEDPARRTYLRILAGEFETARAEMETWAPVPDDPMGILARMLIHTLAPSRHDGSEELAAFPEDEDLRLLLAATDARHIAACGLSAITPPWSLWALDRLRRLDRHRRGKDGPWSATLKARCMISLGDPVLARGLLYPWTKADRPFPPAHYLNEFILHELGAEEQELIDAQARRLAAGGAAELEGVQAKRVRARKLDREGEGTAAIESLEQASRQYPDAAELLVDRSRLLTKYKRRSEAIELYDLLFTRMPSGARPLVPEYLALLDETLLAEEIPEEVWWAELEALESQLPDEPMVARALAAREAESQSSGDPPSESTGPVRALERLQRFRKRTDELPIDGLRRGEVVPWIELHGKLDPEGALELAQYELNADPLAPHLWVALAKALELSGRRLEALQILKVALAFTGSLEPKKMRTLLRFEFSTNFAKLLSDIKKLEHFHGELEDAELRFHRGLARLANPRPKGRKQPDAEAQKKDAIELWDRRDEFGWSAERYAPRLALALSRSGRGGKALAVLKQVAESTSDPLKAQMFTSLRAVLRAQLEEEAQRKRDQAQRLREKKAQASAEATEPAEEPEPAAEEATEPETEPAAEQLGSESEVGG